MGGSSDAICSADKVGGGVVLGVVVGFGTGAVFILHWSNCFLMLL